MYRAVLAHIQRGQMEAEYLCGAAQVGQSPACQIHRAVAEQRFDQHIQVGDELLRRGIGFSLIVYWGQVRDFVAELLRCRRQTRINQNQRASKGLPSRSPPIQLPTRNSGGTLMPLSKRASSCFSRLA